MAEILTESFCERCGTRYTFESPPRGPSPLGVLGTVGRGLRNFVAMPDASLNEAFAVARAETAQGATAHQLEAFQRTFNFCLSCRQYTCAECWNAVEGRCLSCAPRPEPESADAWPTAESTISITSIGEARPFVAGPADLAWPTVQIEPTALVAEPEPAMPAEVAEVEPVAEAEVAAEAEPVTEVAPEEVVAEAEVAAEAEPVTDVAPEEVVAEAEVAAEAEPIAEVEPPQDHGPETDAHEVPRRRPSSLPAFTPGMSLDEEIAAYDLRIAALSVAADSEAPAVPEQPAVMEPLPVFAAPPVVAPPIAAQRLTAPDLPPAPSATPDPALVGATGTCPSCGLSLSASARFCRRCGTQQRA